jgi:hypothetical protein
MPRIITTILVLLAACLSSYVLTSYAAIEIPWSSQITPVSIGVSVTWGNSVEAVKNIWLRILGVLRIVVSGFALIYLVMIGVYMIIWSDSEETVKTQRKQITYALIGFLFLNIPWFVYTIFSPEGNTATIWTVDNWSSTTSGSNVFWNTAGFEGIIGNMIAFLRVFIFGVAVTMFTWGLFDLLVSGGDDEKKKKAKNRIIYGSLALIFLGFVQIWASLIAAWDFRNYVPQISGTLFSLVMYIAAPIAIFMLMWAGYLLITSAWDEERVKRGKSILLNTGIAVILLLSALSFMTDLVGFSL